MATNTRKLAALLGASGAGIADAGTINTAGITADAIDNTKITADAITGGKLADDVAISTTGNIATTGSGTLTVAGAITASGGIANAGTITAGTLGSSVVVPASIGGSEVLLSTYTGNNSSNILAITGMSATYSTYKFVVSGLNPITDSIHVYWYLKEAGGSVRNSGYLGCAQQVYYNGSSTASAALTWANTLFGIDSNLSDAGTYNGVFYVFNPFSSTIKTQGVGMWNYKTVSSGNYNNYVTGGSVYDTAESHTSINIQTESGNWESGTVKMYGLK